MKKHKTQKLHPHHKGSGMKEMGAAHWEKDAGEVSVANGKYASSEMGNPEALKRSVDSLASYARKNKPSH